MAKHHLVGDKPMTSTERAIRKRKRDRENMESALRGCANALLAGARMLEADGHTMTAGDSRRAAEHALNLLAGKPDAPLVVSAPDPYNDYDPRQAEYARKRQATLRASEIATMPMVKGG